MKHSKIVTSSFATVLSSCPARSRRGCGHAIPVLAMIGTMVVAAQSTSADFITADWEADICNEGFWSEIKCWGAEPIPYNGNMGHTYHAIISDGVATVTLNFSITLDRLSVFPLNTMIQPEGIDLTIVGGSMDGSITGYIGIDGVLVMGSTGSFTDLTVTAGAVGSTLRIVNVDGSGDLQMSDHINNRIYGTTGSETIIFGTGLTVGGSGQIGVNLTTLINEGTIVADQSAEIQIDPNAGGMTNSGLMVARDGGVLRLNPAVYDNALGEIRAEDASTVRFQSGAQITGGLMVAQSGGMFEFDGGTLVGPTVRIDVGGVGQVISTSTVLNLTNDGVINQIDIADLHTAGQFNNIGNYFMNSTGSFTDLILDSDTVLDGGGVINMSDHINNRIYGASGAETFTNVDNTIHGSGQIGVDQTTLINEGTIVADQSAEIQIDPNAGGMTNSGLMVARDGGVLRLNPAVYDNALGEIRAEDASTVRFQSGAQITGGLMVAQSGGMFEFDGGTLVGPTVRIDVGGVGQVISTSTVLNLTNDGVINQIDIADLHTAGQFNNIGNYFMNSTGSFTDLILDSDTVLDGGGVINMSDHINNRIYGATGAETFTNVDNTIRGSGQIGVDQTTIINQGTIIADQSAEIQIDPNAEGMTNSGTLGAENGAELHLYPGPFTTSGFVFAAAGSTIRRLADDYIQTAGSTIIDGTLALNAGGVATVTLDGGILGGSGQVNANVNNVSGAASPGSSPGTLTVDGNYTQGIDGECAVEIGGAKPGQFDVLAINDDATLAGTLAVTFINDFDPQIGQSFTILTATDVFGTFDVIDSCAGLSVTYNTDSVVLTITAACAPCPWDLDGDDVVGTGDLILLLGSWGDPYGTADLIELLGNWGPCD